MLLFSGSNLLADIPALTEDAGSHDTIDSVGRVIDQRLQFVKVHLTVFVKDALIGKDIHHTRLHLNVTT